MSCYDRIDEQKIRTQAHVREWTRSGFLDEEQARRIYEDLRVDLRRTNPFLRAVLFVFTVLIVAASIALFAVTFHINNGIPVALTCLASAAICYVPAEYVIRRFRVYRFGVEEALAVCAVVLLSIATVVLIDRFGPTLRVESIFIAALAAGAAGALGLYWRFGYLYAVLAFVACVAALPFQLGLSLPIERVSVALILLATFMIVRSRRRLYGDDFPGDDYGWIQAAALAGLYLDLNLRITASATSSRFYWVTYALVWIIPIVTLLLALRDRDRLLLDVSLAAVLGSVLTNKSYLGLSQKPWDPIVFGLFLSGLAIFIRRWLAKSPEGKRHGFTSMRLLASDRRLLTMAGTATVLFQQSTSGLASDVAAPSKPDFQGGRSGGAGASGSF
jgi:hypothetical protein